MKIFPYLKGFALAASLGTMAVVFLADVKSPLGLTVEALYVVPILLSLMADLPRLTFAVTALCGFLVVLAYFVSPDVGVPHWIVWSDRTVVIIVLALTSWRGNEIGRAKRRMHELEKWLTICAWTKQINVEGEWIPIERYLTEYVGLTLTHGMSQEALDRFMGELRREVR